MRISQNLLELDCQDQAFISSLDELIREVDAASRNQGTKRTLRLQHVRELGRFTHLELTRRFKSLKELIRGKTQVRLEVEGAPGVWEELDLSDPQGLAVALDQCRPPRVVPRPLPSRSLPFWLRRERNSRFELFDLKGLWSMWQALRLIVDGLSLREAAKKLDLIAPRDNCGKWNKDMLFENLAAKRLCPPDPGDEWTEAPRPYLIDRPVWNMLQDALRRRAAALSGRKRIAHSPEEPAQRLLKGIRLECTACRRVLDEQGDHGAVKAELDFSGDPEQPAHPKCRGAQNPLQGLSRAGAAAYALTVIAARAEQDRMRFYEIENPFIDDEVQVLRVVKAMNAEFEAGNPADRGCAHGGGPDPWVLLDRIREPRTKRVDHSAQVITWLKNPPGDAAELHRLWLVISRRFRSISFGPAVRPSATPYWSEPKAQDGSLYAIDMKFGPKTDGDALLLSIETRPHNAEPTLGFERCEPNVITTRCPPEFAHWSGPIDHAFLAIRLEPEGLGAWSVAAETEARVQDDGWEPFVRSIRRHLQTNPLSRIELVDPPGAEEVRASIRDRLGAYSSVEEAGGSQPEATVYLYPARIAAEANRLGCDPLDLARVVLRHECGHHVAPASESERRAYQRDSPNPATMRTEAAAQLFAWLTSAPPERRLIQRLATAQSTPYQVFGQVIDFAVGRCVRQSADLSARPRPGWLLAWSTVRSARYGEFFDLPRERAPLDALQSQWHELHCRIGPEGSWPLLRHLGSGSATMFESGSDRACGVPDHKDASRVLWSLFVSALHWTDRLPDSSTLSYFGVRVKMGAGPDPSVAPQIVLQSRTANGPWIVVRNYLPASEDALAMVEGDQPSPELLKFVATTDG